MKREPTAEQKAKAEERRARFKQLWKQVANMPELERVQLANKLGIVTVEGAALSPRNQCLIALQSPAASVVGGFRQWIKQGRCVKKGEHGAMIWCPTGTRNTQTTADDPNSQAQADSGNDVYFIIGTVFDIGQTQELKAGQPAEVTA